MSRPGVGGGIILGGGLLLWWLLNHHAGGGWILLWGVALLLGGMILPRVADQVTLARAYLAAPAVIYAFDSRSLIGLVVVITLAGGSDLLDGLVARREGGGSKLGGALDPLVDGLFFAAVAGGLALGGSYPLWLAGVIVLRYLLPAVVGGALVLADRPVSLVHTPLGQLATLIIALGLGGLALFRELGWPSGELVMAMTVVMPAVTGAAWLNLFWVNRKAFDLGG